VGQPGGWLYNILPYIEQSAYHDVGAGLSKVRKAMAWDDQVMKPIGTYYCPSRRPALPYGLGWATGTGVTFANLNKPVTLLAKNDYAVNAGDTMYRNNGPDGNPPSTGISFYASNVTMADVKDGSSNTFMCGEKYMNPDAYADEAGTAEWGDDGSAIAGHTWQHARWTYYDSASPENSYVPRQDTPGYYYNHASFGSAHSGGLNMALCDGSVRIISYDIDALTHSRLGNRQDGYTVDAARF
jgi:prepilin-type processing-associated H-X9-DG protein